MAVLQAGAGQRRIPARHDGRRGRQRHDGGGGRASARCSRWRRPRGAPAASSSSRSKRMPRRGTLPGKHVKIPGILVDFVVVDAEQRQTYATHYDPSYSGELRIPRRRHRALPFGTAQGHRAPRRDGALPGRRVQSRLPASRPGLPTIAAEEGLLDARDPDQSSRASSAARRSPAATPAAGRTSRHDRAALAVRLLRWRRARSRVPLVRRSRRRGQRQRQPLRRPDHRRRAASSTSARTREGRDLTARSPPAVWTSRPERLAGAPRAARAGRASACRSRAADQLQRAIRPERGQVAHVRHRARGLPARPRGTRADRDRARCRSASATCSRRSASRSASPSRCAAMDARLFRAAPMDLLPQFRARPEPRCAGLRRARLPCVRREPMSADLIRCRVEDGVAVLTLNNPPLNLVTLELTRELDPALDRLAGDPAARVLVLTGAGERAFCAGSDIREFPSSRMMWSEKARAENDAYSQVDDFPKPTIAATQRPRLRRRPRARGLLRPAGGRGRTPAGAARDQARRVPGSRRHGARDASDRRRTGQGDHVLRRPDRRRHRLPGGSSTG